ncbi:hypothetical protein ACHAWF_001181 [Thalassiosira exigua]
MNDPRASLPSLHFALATLALASLPSASASEGHLRAHHDDRALVGGDYCTWSPNTTCYLTGWPACCALPDHSSVCPEDPPPCGIAAPVANLTNVSLTEFDGATVDILGSDYCTYSPDTDCYTSGWPDCCQKSDCPEERPPCDVPGVTGILGDAGDVDLDNITLPVFDGTTGVILGGDYCTYGPDKSCYANGKPACCLDENETCPQEQPPCDVDTTVAPTSPASETSATTVPGAADTNPTTGSDDAEGTDSGESPGNLNDSTSAASGVFHACAYASVVAVSVVVLAGESW